jgi:hypothetical protein
MVLTGPTSDGSYWTSGTADLKIIELSSIYKTGLF